MSQHNGQNNGLATAVELIGVGGVGDNAEQPELFEADATLPLSPAAKPSGSAGRPAGARNKRTQEMVSYLLSRYRSPLVGLCETYSRSPEDLARELQLYKRVEVVTIDEDGKAKHTQGVDERRLDLEAAFRLQIEAMAVVLPYIHQKLPIAIEGNIKSAGMIVIGHVDGLADGGDGTITLHIEQPKRNQEVIDAEVMKSDDVQSDDAANALSGHMNGGATR